MPARTLLASARGDVLGGEGRALALEIFDHVRALSPDVRGVSRPAWSPVETAVLDYLGMVARRHGLCTRLDAAGGLIMSRADDTDHHARHGLVGSHVDSVPQGGNFDGLAGTVAAMLALISLDRDGVETVLPVRAIAMRGEESAIFGHAYTGSLAMFGRLVPGALAARSVLDGVPLADAMSSCGVDTSRVARGEPLADASHMAFFLELHIEQGPLLLARGWPVATVTGIRGNVRHREIRCLGEAGHSGAVPRWLRRDAVMATADLLIRMDDHWSEIEQQGGDLVLTAGVIHTDASHNAMSRIPGETTFSFEARSQNAATIKAVEGLLHAECADIARDRGVRFVFDAPVHSPGAMLDAEVTAALAAACAAEDMPTETVPSGAGHDAAIFQLAGVPSGMLFVRNENGSHNPDEDMDIDDMLIGARVLRRAAEALAGTSG
ncbi:MAG: hydantoinase/carbamoylase family amidase [Pikeienuella sp.]|uniref:hydantoinase/carbamoylase family amidase n=1 Tax=Pikeienuella sp. TaxID=2831957 RepID=UPI00391922CC